MQRLLTTETTFVMSEELNPEVFKPSDVAENAAPAAPAGPQETAAEENKTGETVAETVSEAVKELAETVAGKVGEKMEDLAGKAADAVDQVKDSLEPVVNFAEKSLAELTTLFEGLMSDEARMKRAKEAEAIKAAFYKKLSKEKADAGLAPAEEPDDEAVAEEVPSAEDAPVQLNPFEAIESGFKSLYNRFRKERAEFNRQLDAERADNLTKKQAVIEEL